MKRSLGWVVFAGSVLLFGADARAHFALQAPACWMSQDAVGTPLKMAPCGDEGGGTATGKVTTFQEGQMITVTINETIFHPGHYRIALATTDRSQLPAEPVPTAQCGSVTVQNPPVFPVLADGLFTHTTAFTAPQTVQIKLPDNVTCTHCTLQVIQFMSNQTPNPTGGCFYHHCADLAIQTAAVPDGGLVSSPADMSLATADLATTLASMDLSVVGGEASDMASAAAAAPDMAKPYKVDNSFIPGCSFAGASSVPSSAWLLLAGCALLMWRRSRRA
jgi:Lytic polysaccharide mono-oxygenase, cellulose-degrading